MMKRLTQESQMNPNGNLWKVAEVKAITKKSLRLRICGGDGRLNLSVVRHWEHPAVTNVSCQQIYLNYSLSMLVSFKVIL